jgi:hypothetical protein
VNEKKRSVEPALSTANDEHSLNAVQIKETANYIFEYILKLFYLYSRQDETSNVNKMNPEVLTIAADALVSAEDYANEAVRNNGGEVLPDESLKTKRADDYGKILEKLLISRKQAEDENVQAIVLALDKTINHLYDKNPGLLKAKRETFAELLGRYISVNGGATGFPRTRFKGLNLTRNAKVRNGTRVLKKLRARRAAAARSSPGCRAVPRS